MAELTLERVFKAAPEKVFDFITQPGNLTKWWGPEGMSLPDAKLDFTRTGPWHSVMQNAEGQQFTVSGQVTHVDRPKSVGFTWAWHDDKGARGSESHVTMTLRPQGSGTAFTLHHRDLSDETNAANHNQGWTSSLRKLERLANATPPK